MKYAKLLKIKIVCVCLRFEPQNLEPTSEDLCDSESLYDTTGMFHWCAEQPLRSCVIVRIFSIICNVFLHDYFGRLFSYGRYLTKPNSESSKTGKI